MATALKLNNDIKKLKSAINSKATPKSFLPKLKAQLEKAENELASLKSGAKPRKTSTTKGTEKTLSALEKLIQKKKYSVYKGAGVDLKKDAGEGALATGRRVSKGLKSNQFGSKGDNKGNVYYEYRPNRLDVKQPKKAQKYPNLEKGGMMAKGGQTKKFLVDDVVYNKRTKTIGIVRLEDERGETKTDADGNVNTSELQHYNPMKYPKQKDAKVAPSTAREIEERGLFQPFKKREKGGEVESLLRKQHDLLGKETDIKLNAELNTQEGVAEYRKKIAPIKEQLRDIDKQLDALGYEAFASGGMMAKGGELKVGGDDFSFLLELSDKELSKRLDLVRKQQDINAKQYFEAKEKGNNTKNIEESGERLQNQETAIIEARIRKNKYASGGMMAHGGETEDLQHLVGSSINVYQMGVKQPTVETIKSIRVTDKKFSNRDVVLETEGGGVDRFPLSKLDDFLKGEDIEITGGKEPYAIALVEKMAKGAKLKNASSEDGFELNDINGHKIEEGDIVKSTQPSGGVLSPAEGQVGVVEKTKDAFGQNSLQIRFRKAGKNYDQLILLNGKINEILSKKVESVKMAYGGELHKTEEYFNEGGETGKNIDVFGYQTKHFDICPIAVSEFESAINQINENNVSESEKSDLAKTAEYVDKIFAIEKGESTEGYDEALNHLMTAATYNYRSGMLVNLYSFMPKHMERIHSKKNFENGGSLNGCGCDDYAEGGKLDIAAENKGMLLNYAEELEHHAKEFEVAAKNAEQVEPWVIAKIERATTDLSDVTHYLASNNAIREEELSGEEIDDFDRGGEIKSFDVIYFKELKSRDGSTQKIIRDRSVREGSLEKVLSKAYAGFYPNDVVAEIRDKSINTTVARITPDGKGTIIADGYGLNVGEIELEQEIEEVEDKPKKKLFGLFAKGGEVTFDDKVKSVKSSLLKRKKVSPKVRKDYGKTYSPKEAEESAKRIVGAMTAKERLMKRIKK